MWYWFILTAFRIADTPFADALHHPSSRPHECSRRVFFFFFSPTASGCDAIRSTSVTDLELRFLLHKYTCLMYSLYLLGFKCLLLFYEVLNKIARVTLALNTERCDLQWASEGVFNC